MSRKRNVTVNYRKFASDRRFGVELEVSNTVSKARIKKIIETVSHRLVRVYDWGASTNNTSWEIKEDASCGPLGMDGPRGFEIASYVGTGIYDIKHIAYVADVLRSKKVQVTDYCGLHIHADASDLSVQQVGRIIAYWLKVEPIIAMSMPVRRRNNEFCRYMSNRCKWLVSHDQKRSAEEMWDLYKPSDLTEHDNFDRRATLNLVNYARSIWYKWVERKTLELRWPEGTLDGTEIKNWLRLFLHFIESVKDRDMPKDTMPADLDETLDILGLHHRGDNFVILSEGLMETKTWFLLRLMENIKKDGVVGVRNGWKSDEIAVPYWACNILNKMWSPLKEFRV